VSPNCEVRIPFGGSKGREIDPQHFVHADYGCHEDRLWDLSLGEDNGMRLEGRTPSSLMGVVQLPGGVAECFLDQFHRYIEGLKETVDEAPGTLTLTSA
jgi:hypothetical protein